jgi:hypothetical protein
MANPFDQFDAPASSQGNPFDRFDATPQGQPSVGPYFSMSPYGLSNELAHSFTMGLQRPLHAVASAIGPTFSYLTGRGSVSPLEAYLRAEQEYDTARKQYSEQYPGLSLTGSIVGALGNVSGVLGKLGAKAATSAGGRILQGAGIGGVYGGISGLAESSGDVVDRLKEGSGHALLGAGIGAAIPGAIETGRVVIAPLRSVISAVRNPEAAAAQQVARAMADDAVSPLLAKQRLREAAQQGVRDMTLADVGGSNMQRLAAVYAKSPGPGKSIAQDFAKRRIEEAPQQIVDVIRPGLGPPELAFPKVQEMMQKRAAAAKPLYERAYEVALNTSAPEYRVIEEMLTTPAGQKALAHARTLMLNERVPSKQILIDVLSDGSVKLSRLPDTRTLDYVKRALDDQIMQLRGTNEGRILTNIKNSIVENLDALNPTYRAARAAWKGPTDMADAIETGQGLLNMPVEEIKGIMAKMTPAERDFARIGVARQIKEMVGGASDKIRALLSPNMREKFKEIFPNAAQYDRAIGALEKIKGQKELSRKIIGGSETYENFAAAGDLLLDPWAATKSARGNIWGLMSGLLRLRALADKFRGITPGVSERGVNILLSPDPMVQQRALYEIASARAQQARLPMVHSAMNQGLLGTALGTVEQLKQ